MHAAFSAEHQKARIEALEAEVEMLQTQLGSAEDAERIVKRHIQLLHLYNESKDATQILIGRLASLKETTIKQIHDDYDLMDQE